MNSPRKGKERGFIRDAFLPLHLPVRAAGVSLWGSKVGRIKERSDAAPAMLWLACVLPEHRRCAPRSGLRGLAAVTLINTFRSDAAPVDVVLPEPHKTVE